MRLNYETCLSGSKCVLVPYRREHVDTYHEWMKDPNLLEMTGSEPLTHEEEVRMQALWRDDDDKCTFIILDRSECAGGGAASTSTSTDDGDDHPDFVRNNLGAMVGDVNLFLSDEEEDDDDDKEGSSREEKSGEIGIRIGIGGAENPDDDASPARHRQAELDIMIAVKRCRGKGLGTEASRMIMLYGAEQLGIRRFFVKIKEENVASREMFGTTLGFIQCNYVECFREVELEFRMDTAEEMAIALRGLLKEDVVTWRSTLPAC